MTEEEKPPESDDENETKYGVLFSMAIVARPRIDDIVIEQSAELHFESERAQSRSLVLETVAGTGTLPNLIKHLGNVLTILVETFNDRAKLEAEEGRVLEVVRYSLDGMHCYSWDPTQKPEKSHIKRKVRDMDELTATGGGDFPPDDPRSAAADQWSSRAARRLERSGVSRRAGLNAHQTTAMIMATNLAWHVRPERVPLKMLPLTAGSIRIIAQCSDQEAMRIARTMFDLPTPEPEGEPNGPNA